MTSPSDPLPVGCACCKLDRRRFLAGCAACAAGASGIAPATARTARAAEAARKPRIRLVFSHVPSTGPVWPNIGYDFERRKKELAGKLTAACPNIEFLPTTMMNEQDLQRIREADGEVDGYLIWFVGLWTGQCYKIAAMNKPTVMADDLYGGSGEFLIAYSAARRAGHRTVGVSSARFDDLAAVVNTFGLLTREGAGPEAWLTAAEAARRRTFAPAGELKCEKDEVRCAEPGEVIKRLGESTMLVVGATNPPLSEAITKIFGVRIVPVEFAELDQAWAAADRDESAAHADRWIRDAEKVVEPAREEIVKSAAMYLAMRALLQKHGAQAITINCLGGFYGGHIHAYPCLGFTQLNDDGLVGACEADQISTITMMVLGYLTGRPSYISDPVIDTSTNRVIYAHCVAPTRVFGPNGRRNAYHIRDHSEDRKGAALRSLLPLDYLVSSMEFHPLHKQVVFHQGRTVENVDEDMACRTKLAAEVKGDIDRLMTQWDLYGWHRVTVYGDVAGPVTELAERLGMKMLQEA